MDKHEQAIARGEEATRILNSDTFASSFAAIREAYLREWEDMPTSNTEAARDIHRRLKCLADVRTALQAHISSGKLAAKELSMRERVGNGARTAFDRIINR